MSKKTSGSAPANVRKVEKKNAGTVKAGAGTGKAGAVKAETPKAAKAAPVQPVKVKCSPAQAKADNAAIKAEAAKIEAMKKVVMAFVSVDVTQKTLQAPYHDKAGRVVVATDGRALLATRYGFNPSAKDRDYPAWRQVVPNYEKSVKGITTFAFNPGNLLAVCREAKRLAGAVSCESVYLRFLLIDGAVFGMSLENAKRLAEAMIAGNLSEAKACGPDRAMIAGDENTTVVVMPIRGYADQPGRGSNALSFDAMTGRCISAPVNTLTDYIKARAKELADDRDSLSKKELAELAKLEKQIAAENEIDALLAGNEMPAGKPAQTKTPAEAAQKPAEKPAKPGKPSAQPEAAKPAETPEAVNPYDYSADLATWRKLAKTNPHEARADVATWASLLPVADDSNVVFVACLDTFASVAYLLEKAGRRIVSLEKMSDDAARTFKAELAKVLDAKACADLAACL